MPQIRVWVICELRVGELPVASWLVAELTSAEFRMNNLISRSDSGLDTNTKILLST